MSLFFQRGPQFIQNYQRNLNGWVPTAPEDAVWGAAKSVVVSMVVTAFITQGSLVASTKSAFLAAVASTVHTLSISIFNKVLHYYTAGIPVEIVDYFPHAVSLFALFSSYLLGRKINMSLLLTIPATGIPYFLTQSQQQIKIKTPLFVTIVNY